jgi:hypothetical protein
MYFILMDRALCYSGTDVYFSPNYNTFTVSVEPTGVHNVQRDGSQFIADSNISRKRRSTRHAAPHADQHTNNNNNANPRHKRDTTVNDTTGESYYLQEFVADDLNTFVTIHQKNTILIVRNVRCRMVITLPLDRHDLRTSRFYIILYSKLESNFNATSGSLYFRQDQPHIDLFVFFSVFFSCFFLFLAKCVLLWKIKQAFDTRRSRQQRAREMQHMASRPFAKALILVEHELYPTSVTPIVLPRNRLSKFTRGGGGHPAMEAPGYTTVSRPVVCPFDVVPIALEPTDDGVAAVATVVLQLPGGVHAPAKLCMGSTLTMRVLAGVVGPKMMLRRRPSASQC